MPKQINVKLGFDADTSQAKKQIQDLQKSLDSLLKVSSKGDSFDSLSKGVAEAQQSVLRLKNVLDNSLNIDTGRLDLSKFNQQLNQSGLSIDKLATQMNSLGADGQKAFLNLANSIVTAQKPMMETNRLLDGMWTALKNTMRWQFSSSMLHGFMSSIQGAYGYAQDLNASLNSIRIVSGQSVEQMAAFADQANRSAQALSTSTLAYTDAALIFYQQGLSGDAVTERVNTVLKLSNVTGDSAEQVSNYMTAIWNNFYDGSESLESFADKITALGAATASSSAEISAGLQQFAAIGQTVGLSYDYAATALATIVAQTRQSESTVGNGLRTVFARLSSLKQGGSEDGVDLTKYTAALKEVGVNVMDQNGQLKEMDQILEDIGSKWETLSKNQQVALAQTVGGVRQYATLIALFDNWDQFQRNLDVTKNSEGTLEEQAEIYAESWEAARKRVQAAWQAIYQDLLDDSFFIWLKNAEAEILKGIHLLIQGIGGLKGVIPLVISAIMTLFGDKVANGIDSIRQRIRILTGEAERDADKVAQRTMNALNQMTTGKWNDYSKDAIVENLKTQVQLNNDLRKIKGELKQEDIEYLSYLIKQTEEYTKQSVAAHEKFDEANKNKVASIGNIADIINDRPPGADEYTTEAIDKVRNTLAGDNRDFNNSINQILALKDAEQEYSSIQEKLISDLTKMGQAVGVTSKDWREYVNCMIAVKEATKNVEDTDKRSELQLKAINKVMKERIPLEQALAEIKKASNIIQEKTDDNNRLEQEKKQIQETIAHWETYKNTRNVNEEIVKRIDDQYKNRLDEINQKIAKNSEEIAKNTQVLNGNSDAKNKNSSIIGGDSKSGFNADQIVKGAQAISQLTMAATSLINVWSLWTDEQKKSIPVGEKIKQTISAIVMVIPAFIFGVKSLNVAINGAAAANATFAASLSAVLGPLALFAAAIVAIYAAFRYFNADQIALDNSNQRLEEAKQKAEETAAAYDNLKSSLEEYNDVAKEISNMAPGLDKTEAVIEENQKILDALEEANLLDFADLTYNKDGLIEITGELQKQLEEAALINKLAELRAQYEEKITNEILKRNEDYKEDYKESDKIYLHKSDPDRKYWNEQVETGGQGEDITQKLVDLFRENNLNSHSDEELIKKTIFDAFGEDGQEAFDAFMNSSAEAKTAFDGLISSSINLQNQQENYSRLIAQTMIGSDVEKATSFGPAQQALLDTFASLGPEVQNNIVSAIENGSLTFSEAFAKNGYDVAEIIHNAMVDAAQGAVDNAGSVLGTNGSLTFSDDEEIAQKQIKFVMSLSDEDLANVGGWAGLQESIDKIGHEHNIDINVNAEDFTQLKSSIKDEDLMEEVQSLADYLQDYADEVDDLSDHLAECRAETEKIAYAIMRFDDAIQDVTENYNDWSDALAAGGQRAAMAFKDLAKAYGNVMDIDGSALSTEFLSSTEHLNDMKLAIEGNEEAYNRLLDAAARDDLANNFGQSASQIDSLLGAVSSAMNAIEQELGRPIQAGENIRSDALEQSLNNILALVGNNVDAANRMLAELGYDAELQEVTEKKPANTQTVDLDVTPDKPVAVTMPTYEGLQGMFGPKTQTEYVSGGFTVTPRKQDTPSESVETVTALKIKPGTVHKAVGGSVKFKQATHGGGGVSPSSGKSGGGGGGGGGSKKKTVKEHKKPEKKEDRYHDIKERIEDLNTELKRLQKTEDRVYGKAKLKYMDQEIEKLEKQIELTDEYIAEIKKYAAIDQANLRGIGMGAQFDENGRLTNYEEVLSNIVSSYNSSIAAYNSAADAFNASAQEDEDSAALEIAEKQVSAAKEVYDERLKILDQYEDTYNLYQQKMDERIDQVWELFDKRLEKITWRIEFELDWNEKELTQFDWLLKYIGKDADHAADAVANLSKQMGVYEESLEWAKQGIAGIFDLHGITFDFDNADPQQLYNQLADFMNAQNLESQLTEKEADALLDYMDAMRDAYDGMYDAWIDAHDHMMNAWDEWQERLQDGLNDIAQYGKELEGIQKVIDLTGRKMLKMTTQDINRMNQALVVNAQEYLRAATARRDALEPSVQAAEAHLQELIAGGASEEAIQLARDEYRKMMEDWQDATNDWYDAFADALQAGENAFNAFIENSTKDYKEGFGKMDLDYMTEQFDRQKKVRDLYLDDYQKYHELNKTAQELNKSLAATNNDLIREKLLDLQDDMNASMQDGVKISSAQAEIYARRVALLQAEAELLDAQNAKSAVRMTRDNEGNFSYTYTADQEQIGEAQNNYGDKFYELLDFERNYADQIQEEMLQSFQDFIDRRNEIAELYKGDQDAYNQAMQDLQEEYLAYMDYYVGELDMDFYEMGRLRNDDWLDFEDITGQKLAEHDDFIDHFTETITGQLTEDYNTAGELANQWRALMEKSCQDSTQAVNNYQINTETTYNKAGENIETYGQKVNQKFDEMANKSVNTADAVEDMSNDMVNAMAAIQGETYELDNTWAYVMDDMRNQIANTISALQQLMQSLDLVVQKAQAAIAAAQAAAMAQQWAGLGNDVGGGSGSGPGGGSGNVRNPGKTANPGTQDTLSRNTTITSTYGPNKAVHEWEHEGNTIYADKIISVSSTGANGHNGMPSDILRMIGYDSGGYTGAWGSNGKLAMLHEKELVLNKEDTENILSVVDTVRNMISSFGGNVLNDIAKSITNSGSLAFASTGTMDQNVHIEANFPNVQSHSEIEMALNNLINSASQYVNKK